jgi:hypothetical protein
MKKTALIISGEYRTFETVVKFWNIPDNYDLYFSTWDYSNETRKYWASKEDGNWKINSVPFLTTNEQGIVSSFGEEYQQHSSYSYNLTQTQWIYNYEIENRFPESIRKKSKVIKIHPHDIYINSEFNDFRSQIYHWKYLLTEIEKNWDDYDSIMFYRIDSIIWINEGSFEWFEENTLVTPSSTNLNNWKNYQDNWFGGKKDVVRKFINSLSLVNPIEVHGDIAKILKKEIVDYKSYNHKGIKDYDSDDLHYQFIRFGIAEWLNEYYNKVFKHNPCTENLPHYQTEFQELNQYTNY